MTLKHKISDQQRWEILGILKNRTKTKGEITELVGVSQKCVNTTKRNFQATPRVKNFGNCGKRPKLSNRELSYIISKETVRRVLAKKGIETYSAVKKPLLTVSDRTKRRNWTDKDRAKITIK
ncbi:hypothetical protein BpHYR1_008249 [Brachionus plicatilis]|uniref:Transposase Tc1-like domain-containing protein n=1 Tax=Brachionus plicatilis TaxID=10195 RepID=A0A3M7SCE6_BRAPC|nr:hypothetical protein BpHYR1_008249 [Brachionus plicatilis]